MRIAKAGAMPSVHTNADRLDSDDAALVERAWKTLAPKHRELLRWYYIRQANPAMICRRMGIKPRPTSIFDLELARAEAEIARMLSDFATREQGFATSTRAYAREAA